MKTVLKKMSPNLMVKDVKATLNFYRKHLDFELVMAVPASQDGILTEITEGVQIVYALIKRGDIELMLQATKSLKEDVPAFKNYEIGASVSFYFEVENLEGFYGDIKDKVEVVKDLSTTWYGMNEFYISDNNGYILGFAEQKGDT